MKGRKPAHLRVVTEASIALPRARTRPAPSWMSDDAKAEWRRIMPAMTRRRILTDADMGSVENYCIAIGQVRDAQRQLDADGLTVMTDKGLKAHPAFRIQADAMNRARLLAAELGLTPVSRSRPSVTEEEPDDDGADLDL